MDAPDRQPPKPIPARGDRGDSGPGGHGGPGRPAGDGPEAPQTGPRRNRRGRKRGRRTGRGGGDAASGPTGESPALRPTPVRQSLDRPGELHPEEARERTFGAEGLEWVARAVGFASGARGSGRLHLLELSFTTGEGAPARYAVVVGGSLEEMTEHELKQALDRSRPREAG